MSENALKLLNANATKFSIGDSKFIIDVSLGYNRRPSDDEAFTIVKSPDYLNLYITLSETIRPRTLLELGVFQGGSFVFLDKVFRPQKMSAVELSPKEIAPLKRYVDSSGGGRSVHYGHSQVDKGLLTDIVANELGGVLDLVVDDASHLFEETRSSFDVLFPLLSPGGYYIIEDWSWAHHPLYQGENAPHWERLALTNLIFDLIMLQGSTNLLDEVRVYRPFVLIHKAVAPVSTPENFWGLLRTRGHDSPRI